MNWTMNRQEEEFECIRRLIVALQTRTTEMELLQVWHDFLQELWSQFTRLNRYEWGRNVRMNIGFALKRIEEEIRKHAFKGPWLTAGDTGYVCDSLKCQLMAEDEKQT